MIIGMLLVIISRVMNAKIFSFMRRKAKSQDLFVRHVDGQTYVRRSVLIYMITGLYVVCFDDDDTDVRLDVQTNVT
jgi:hypothetical protein